LVASLLPALSPLSELAYLLNALSSHLPPLSLFILLVFLHYAIVPPIPIATILCCISYGSSFVVDRFVFARSIILRLILVVMCLAVLPSGFVHVHPTFCFGFGLILFVCLFVCFFFPIFSHTSFFFFFFFFVCVCVLIIRLCPLSLICPFIS
jgi:hypothetical protein